MVHWSFLDSPAFKSIEKDLKSNSKWANVNKYLRCLLEVFSRKEMWLRDHLQINNEISILLVLSRFERIN